MGGREGVGPGRVVMALRWKCVGGERRRWCRTEAPWMPVEPMMVMVLGEGGGGMVELVAAGGEELWFGRCWR